MFGQNKNVQVEYVDNRATERTLRHRLELAKAEIVELNETIKILQEEVESFNLLRILSTTGLIRDSGIATKPNIQQILEDVIVTRLETLISSSYEIEEPED